MKKTLCFLACIGGLVACVPAAKYKTLLSEHDKMKSELTKLKEMPAVDTVQLPCDMEKEKAALRLKEKEIEKRAEMINQSAMQKVAAAEQKIKELEEQVKKLKGE